MNNLWPNVRIDQILRRVERFESRNDLADYQFAGTYSFGRGIFLGERKTGLSFKLPRVQRIHSGDFIYCKIMAWEGAFGIAPDVVENAVMSNAFVVYELDRTIIDDRFLGYLFSVPSNWKRIGGQSTGTNVRRQSLNPDQFECSEIFLPPLAEQQRIVARIEEVASQIMEARTLREESIREGELLLRSILAHDKLAPPVRMSELVRLRATDVVVQADQKYEFAGVYCFGRGMFRSGQKSGMEFAYKRLTRVNVGEFVYPKLMAWEGALTVVPPECDECVVSPEFPVFAVNEARVFPEVLDVYFRTPSVWPKLSETSTGTNVRRRRLNPQDFLAYEMPLPSRATQVKLKAAYAQIKKLRVLQSETAAELDALLPSVLSKAFSGEL